MAGSWQPLLITCMLGLVSAGLGLLLYRFSRSTVKQRGIRISGAAAISVIAYLGMSRFYISLQSDAFKQSVGSLTQLRDAIDVYDSCAEHERTFACQQPATSLRDACARTLP
jgi:hypothetical protein